MNAGTHQVDDVMLVQVDERLGYTHQDVATPAKAQSLTKLYLSLGQPQIRSQPALVINRNTERG